MPILYLTGYEKETIEEFIEKLEKAGITTVIDVREIPLSRKNSDLCHRLIAASELLKIKQELGEKLYR